MWGCCAKLCTFGLDLDFSVCLECGWPQLWPLDLLTSSPGPGGCVSLAGDAALLPSLGLLVCPLQSTFQGLWEAASGPELLKTLSRVFSLKIAHFLYFVQIFETCSQLCCTFTCCATTAVLIVEQKNVPLSNNFSVILVYLTYRGKWAEFLFP